MPVKAAAFTRSFILAAICGIAVAYGVTANAQTATLQPAAQDAAIGGAQNGGVVWDEGWHESWAGYGAATSLTGETQTSVQNLTEAASDAAATAMTSTGIRMADATPLIPAPVIPAPDDAGRLPPSSAYQPYESAGFNSFAAPDMPVPVEGLGLADPLPVVVELFTSQGCSSCPAADAMLAGMSQNPDVLPLSFHVDYWDYLGWPDSFARPEFTQRQEQYARAAGEHAVYTPQLIVDGTDTAVSLGPSQLMGLVNASRLAPAMVSVRRDRTTAGQVIELTPLSDLGGGTDIMLVRYAPERAVEMTAGENRGKVVTYTNVVLSIERLADWDGAGPLRVTVRPEGAADSRYPADTRHAILVQKETERRSPQGSVLPGSILAAIRLD